VHPTSAFIIATADRAGTLTPLKTKPGRYIQVRASRDGRRLAVETDDGKEANVSTLELGGTTSLMRLTYGGRNRFPVWSPDGQRVAFQSDRDGDLAVFAQRIDGTGVVRLTKPERSEAHVPESWSADGRHLSFTVQRGADYTLWTLSLADGKATRFGKAQSVEPMGSTFSPDGKWIAYHALPADVAAQSSSAGVFVEPFPAADARFQAPRVLRDFQPVWSLNGTELFYVASAVSGELAAVPVSSRAGMTFGTPAALPFLVNAGRLSVSTRAFDVLPDGTFVGVVAEASADRPGMITDIRIVLNWHEELKRLVPTR
jgi:Tol biopolymer transport system component